MRFPLAISAIPSLGEKHVISGGRGGWASTGVSLAAGSGMKLSPLAGFCIFILMILQALILSF